MSCETTEYASLQPISTIPNFSEIIVVENGTPRRMSYASFVSTVGADKHYAHTQTAAISVWSISHNLNKYPSPVIIDTDGDVVECDLAYPDANTITLTFSNNTAGVCYLN